MSNEHRAHDRAALARYRNDNQGSPGAPHRMLWAKIARVMCVVTLFMINGWGDSRNNLIMFYMAVIMWAPIMLPTMPRMYPSMKA